MNQRCARRAEDVKCNRWACQTAWAAQHVPMLIGAALRDVVIRLNAMHQKALDQHVRSYDGDGRPFGTVSLSQYASSAHQPSEEQHDCDDQ